MITILDAIEDVFPAWFKDRETWQPWFTFLRALFALPMSESELALYRQCTGRKEPPSHPVQEAWLVIGRRGGKSFTLALIAVFLACFHEYREHLNKGERGTVMVIAQDRRQARVIMRFIRALLQVPMLARMAEREVAEGFDLNNQITIEIHVASFRSTRGYTLVAGLLDEVAFWPSEGAAEPDYEVINALRPGMATVPGAMLLCASSPYGRKGALWEAYHRYYGKDGPLIWQAPTRVMNPTVPDSVICQAMERDPASASAEYLAEFRSDIEGFVTREVVSACVSTGLYERPPQSNQRYAGFVDPSGGSADSFTLAIAHRDADQVFLDVVREVRPPFSPEAVVSEFATTLKNYRISKISGDKFAGVWPVEVFRKHEIVYEQSAKAKSDIYVAFLPLLNSRRVELLDQQRLIAQLVGLERRTARGGRDSIDHPPSAHDDLANAAAGVLTLAQRPVQHLRMFTIADGCAGQNFQQVEIDVATGRPMQQRTRLRWINCDEQGRVLKSRYG